MSYLRISEGNRCLLWSLQARDSLYTGSSCLTSEKCTFLTNCVNQILHGFRTIFSHKNTVCLALMCEKHKVKNISGFLHYILPKTGKLGLKIWEVPLVLWWNATPIHLHTTSLTCLHVCLCASHSLTSAPANFQVSGSGYAPSLSGTYRACLPPWHPQTCPKGPSA